MTSSTTQLLGLCISTRSQRFFKKISPGPVLWFDCLIRLMPHLHNESFDLHCRRNLLAPDPLINSQTNETDDLDVLEVSLVRRESFNFFKKMFDSHQGDSLRVDHMTIWRTVTVATENTPFTWAGVSASQSVDRTVGVFSRLPNELINVEVTKKRTSSQRERERELKQNGQSLDSSERCRSPRPSSRTQTGDRTFER
jgi:hypothetical protein